MTEDVGRVGKPTGLSQAEPQEGLGPSGFDPSRDDALWFREDRVWNALNAALRIAIGNGGQPAKAFAWDVNQRFRQLLDGGINADLLAAQSQLPDTSEEQSNA